MNAVLIQMIILILCYLYILITISSKNYQKKGIRASEPTEKVINMMAFLLY